MLSIQEVLRQMQEAVHIGSGVDPMRVGVWMMTIEATMREPVAWWLTGTSCVLRYGPEGVQDHPKWSPLFAIPPDAARLKEEGDAWGRELVVRNRELTEAQAEIKQLRKALEAIVEVDADMGIYPAAVRGFHDERDYERRDGYKNGWNAACMEFTQKAIEIANDALAEKQEYVRADAEIEEMEAKIKLLNKRLDEAGAEIGFYRKAALNKEMIRNQLDAERLKTELPRPPPPPPARQLRSGWLSQYETKESIKAREDYEAFMRGYRYAYGKEDA